MDQQTVAFHLFDDRMRHVPEDAFGPCSATTKTEPTVFTAGDAAEGASAITGIFMASVATITWLRPASTATKITKEAILQTSCSTEHIGKTMDES